MKVGMKDINIFRSVLVTLKAMWMYSPNRWIRAKRLVRLIWNSGTTNNDFVDEWKNKNCAYRYKSLTHAQNTAHPPRWVPISVFSGATTMKQVVRITIKSCRRFSIEEKYAQPEAIISWISLKKMTVRKKYKARAVSLAYQHSLILLPSAWQIGSSLYGRAVFSQSTVSLFFLQVLLKE